MSFSIYCFAVIATFLMSLCAWGKHLTFDRVYWFGSNAHYTHTHTHTHTCTEDWTCNIMHAQQLQSPTQPDQRQTNTHTHTHTHTHTQSHRVTWCIRLMVRWPHSPADKHVKTVKPEESGGIYTKLFSSFYQRKVIICAWNVGLPFLVSTRSSARCAVENATMCW